MSALDSLLMRALPWLYALPAPLLRWFLLALTAVVGLWAGRGIYASAWRALRHGATNMNTLVSLGTASRFAYSAYATIAPAPGREVYFDAVLLILGFLLLGKGLEAQSQAPRAELRLTRSRGCGRRLRGALLMACRRLCRLKRFAPATNIVVLPGERIPGGRDDS